MDQYQTQFTEFILAIFWSKFSHIFKLFSLFSKKNSKHSLFSTFFSFSLLLHFLYFSQISSYSLILAVYCYFLQTQHPATQSPTQPLACGRPSPNTIFKNLIFTFGRLSPIVSKCLSFAYLRYQFFTFSEK